MNPNNITLTEVSRKDEAFQEEEILVNSNYITLVQGTTLEADDVHIIGHTKERELTQITLHNGQRVYVAESVDEVGHRIKKAIDAQRKE